jgi:hypothetical protein
MKKRQPKSNIKSQLAEYLRELAFRQRKSQLAEYLRELALAQQHCKSQLPARAPRRKP